MSSIGKLGAHVKQSHHAIMVGCVDPTPGEQSTRAVSTLALLRVLASARLPILPPPVLPPPVPAAAAETAGAPASSAPGAEKGVQPSLDPGWVSVPVVDEEIRHLLDGVRRLVTF